MWQLRGLADLLDRPVIVAVIAVGMVEPAVDDVVDMVPMGHRLVAAAGTVLVAVVVRAGVGRRRASIRILVRDTEGVFLDAAVRLLVVQMAVVEVVDMVAVANGGVAAAVTVLMIVVLVELAFPHDAKDSDGFWRGDDPRMPGLS